MPTNIGFRQESDSEEEKDDFRGAFNGSSEPYVLEGAKAQKLRPKKEVYAESFPTMSTDKVKVFKPPPPTKK